MNFSLHQALSFLISLTVCFLLIFAFGALLSSTGSNSIASTVSDSSFFKSNINEQIISDKHPVLNVDEIYIELNDPNFTYDYLKTKASAIDPRDGNITNKILVKGKLDITKAGSYNIRFSVENSLGLKTSCIKKVIID